MKLYHGTNVDFRNISLSKCKPNKDFGRGFYLIDIRRQAQAILWNGTSHRKIEKDMRLTNKQLQFIINSDVEQLVAYLQEDYRLPLLEAFDKVYSSRTYMKLADTATGLYLQSPDYIYDYLKTEIAGDWHV